MRIGEMIVVEGRNDTITIQQAVWADTLETGGSALHKETLARINLAHQRRGVIIFTDPDYPGERLRKLISQAIPGCKHAFLPKEKAISKQGKIGVEHASVDDIRAALQDVKTEGKNLHHDIPWSLLVDYGLVGGSGAHDLRRKIGNILGIGQANAKQFYKRLHVFRISNEEFRQACQAVKKGW